MKFDFRKLHRTVHVLTVAMAMLMPHQAVIAQGSSPHFQKNNFTESDIFQTAVFLQNKEIVEPYKGEEVLYFTHRDHVNAFFTEKGVIYKIVNVDTKKAKELAKERELEKTGGKKEDEESKHTPLTSSIVKMEWMGANPHPQIEVDDKSGGYYTYLKEDGKAYRTLITEGYKRLVYKNLYPGIDVEYMFPEKGGVEYNLIVHPGANVDLVKMVYNGEVKKIAKNNAGDLTVYTNSGNLVEHAPVSFTATAPNIRSEFLIKNNTAQFNLPGGYDHSETLTIDPWVTTMTSLPPQNLGFNVGYDVLGNLYAYGPGYDGVTYFQCTAKYSPNGTFLWTFNGSVGITWSGTSGGAYIGGFIVDVVTGKCYLGQGYQGTGAITARINTLGVYDNFVSQAVGTFRECWGFAFDCSSTTVLAVGGGTNSNLNMGVVNTSNGTVTTSNITGIAGFQQDIISGAYDAFGSLYVIMNSDAAALPFSNVIYKVNSTYNGSVWPSGVNSGFTSFTEAANSPYTSEESNWHNCLAANGNYLFYYDGQNLAAYSLANGSMVGSTYTIPGYTALNQGGIAVDKCNNVYVGGTGVIKTFNFNGSAFTPGTDISLGAGFTTNAIHDLRLNSANNTLYATGDGVAGTYIATASISCNVGVFKVSASNSCGSTLVHVSPQASLSPLQFTYVLLDTNYNVLSQQPDLADTLATFSGLSNNTYYVQVQWNVNCGGTTITDTINIHCTADSVSPPASICKGDSVTISARGIPGGGTYTWAPGGFTDSVITVSPATTSTYTVTYTPPVGAVYIDSVKITVLSLASLTVNDTAMCQGDSVVLSATPSQAGGSYSWSPGGYTTASIKVAPSVSTTYHVTYTAQCNAPVDSGTVTVQFITLTAHNDTVCQGSAAQVSVTPSVSGGTYSWSPGGGNTQAINNILPVNSGNYVYTVTYSLANCSVTDSAFVLVDSLPALITANDTICQGSTATLSVTASLAGGTYNWMPGNFNTAGISVNPATSTTYYVSYVLAACTASDSARVVVDPKPTLTMTGDSICITNTGQVSANPSVTGGTYLWAPGGNTTAMLIDSPTISTTYTVTYTVGLCTANGSATITVLPLPTVSLTGDSVCDGTTVQLTAVPSRGNGTYTWVPGGNGPRTISVTPSTTSAYAVTYTIAGCGSATDSAMVGVWPVPTLSTTDTAFCSGSSGQVSVTPSVLGGTYLWAPGGGSTPAITVSPAATTTYVIKYTTVNGCSATDSAIATVHRNPSIQISLINASCGQPNGSEIANVSAGSIPYAYLWSTSAITDSITGLPGNQTYSVSVIDIYQCSASGSAFISQSSAVSALSAGVNLKCPGYNDGYASATASGGISPYTFAWSNQQSTDSVYNLAPGNYTVTVSDTTGCSASAMVTILDAIPDTFNFTTQPTSCYGPQYQDGSLNVVPVTTLHAPYQYSVAGGAYQNSGSFTNLAFGLYNVNVQDDSGCITPINNIEVHEAPQGFASIYPADTTLAIGQTIHLSATLTPYPDSTINHYNWSPSLGLSCTDCPNPVVSSYAPLNLYTLTITYNGHCTAIDSATVRVKDQLQVFIPDAFTPNNDGNNDVFYIYGDGIRSVDLKVFNRWGLLMFEGYGQFEGWDGKYKGEVQPPAVYVYEATIYSLSGQTIFRTGSVTLLR